MAENASLEILPKTSLGQYEIRGRLGSGGMGDVYDAMHTALNKRVAIKTLKRRFLDDEVVVARFLREGQLASRIRHPNIVDVTDVGMMGGVPCLVMEHLEGESLSALIKRDGALPVAALVDLLLPIIAAVDHAHEQGVLHRDLKPSNIFLSRSWNGETVPKVLDFGISKLVHESAQAALTTDSAFVGTPHYASPESIRADRTADGRADQYSMGVILYEGATGARPFADKGNHFVGLAMAVCNGDYAPPRVLKPELPEAFERVVLRAMALDPAQRFPSMRALGQELLAFASDRARLIWAPAFSGAQPVVEQTEMLARSGATAAIPSRPPFSGAQPVSGPHRWPSGSMTPAPFVHASGQMPIPPGTPVPGAMLMPPGTTPPAGTYDRVPSFGHGNTMASPGPERRSGAALATTLGVALAALVVLGVVVLKKTGRATPAEQPPGASVAVPSSTFDVVVETSPETAVVEVDGVAAGTGRFARTFVRDGRKHVLRVSAPGHESLLVEFDDARPPPARVALRPIAVAGGTAAPTPPKGGSGPSAPGTKGGKGAKGSDPRPKTDNIDPWE